MSVRYLWLEMRRQLRNARSLIFTFALPVFMLLIFGNAYGAGTDPGSHLRWTVAITVQMAGYGGMMAALSQAFIIVSERSIGWNRQLRITPLSGFGYMLSKVVVGLTVSAISVLVVSIVSVLVLHTSQTGAHWALSGLALWAGTLPFALIAIVIGQFAKPQYAQALYLIVFFGLAILGGLWVPLSILPGWVANVAKIVPSYWLNRFGQMGAGASGEPWQPIVVLICWAIVLAAFIGWRYRGDSARS